MPDLLHELALLTKASLSLIALLNTTGWLYDPTTLDVTLNETVQEPEPLKGTVKPETEKVVLSEPGVKTGLPVQVVENAGVAATKTLVGIVPLKVAPVIFAAVGFAIVKVKVAVSL